MAMIDRAAQFSPFAALTGYDAAIQETVRTTEKQMELSDEAKVILDSRLQLLREQLMQRPIVTITYFVPDKTKAGGTYISVNSVIMKIREFEHNIVLGDGTEIPIDRLCAIEGDLFK